MSEKIDTSQENVKPSWLSRLIRCIRKQVLEFKADISSSVILMAPPPGGGPLSKEAMENVKKIEEDARQKLKEGKY